MRLSLLILVFSILSACSTAPTEEQGTTAPTEPLAGTPVVWPGYYTGTMRTPNLPEVEFALWVRSDSTFVRHAGFVGRDSIPQGIIGHWHVVNGRMALRTSDEKPDLFRHTAKGLLLVDEMGEALTDGVPVLLEKIADEINAEIPRMKVSGTFTYYADAMSFRPCGSRFSWPCAGGEQWTDEGEVLGSLNTAELERHYLRSVEQGGDPWLIEVECNLAMGPAMEGDGADEYLFIHRVLGPIETCP